MRNQILQIFSGWRVSTQHPGHDKMPPNAVNNDKP